MISAPYLKDFSFFRISHGRFDVELDGSWFTVESSSCLLFLEDATSTYYIGVTLNESPRNLGILTWAATKGHMYARTHSYELPKKLMPEDNVEVTDIINKMIEVVLREAENGLETVS